MAKNNTTDNTNLAVPEQDINQAVELITNKEENVAVAMQEQEKSLATENPVTVIPRPNPIPDPMPEQENERKIYSIAELAERRRLASWHSAALHKMMNWEEGKLVSESEYEKAIESLKHRRIGG